MSTLYHYIISLLAAFLLLGGHAVGAAPSDSYERNYDAHTASVILSAPEQPQVIRRVETIRPYVAITIDDFYTGDYRRHTGISMLQEANALRTTLTLCPAGSALVSLSQNAPDQASELKQLFNSGSYELCNHTYNHPIMPRLSLKAQTDNILRGQNAVASFFGQKPNALFRPPFGSWNRQTVEAAAQAGYPRIILWSIDSGDSEGPEQPTQKLVRNVACARPGDIILMHANRRSSAVALPLIIKMLRSKGLEPVSLSRLLASGKPIYSRNPIEMKHNYTCRN